MKNKKIFNRLLFLLMGLFLVFAISCDKDADVPVLSTTEVTGISQTTAMSGGNITHDGGAIVTARGVCWSTNENPTIDDNKTEDGNGAGSFTSSIMGLEPNTTYYIRAYATNSVGISYGGVITFTTKEEVNFGSFIDPRDGKAYQTVIIGNQEWMAENLVYAPSSGNFWAYANNNSNIETYGYLYDWETAMDACPAGWHLPGDDEWTELIDYLGCEKNAGGKLKATGTIEDGTGLWHAPNGGATNVTGFTAFPGGTRGSGTFYTMGLDGFWWSATEYGDYNAWYRRMSYYPSDVYRLLGFKNEGLSVRCLRD